MNCEISIECWNAWRIWNYWIIVCYRFIKYTVRHKNEVRNGITTSFELDFVVAFYPTGGAIIIDCKFTRIKYHRFRFVWTTFFLLFFDMTLADFWVSPWKVVKHLTYLIRTISSTMSNPFFFEWKKWKQNWIWFFMTEFDDSAVWRAFLDVSKWLLIELKFVWIQLIYLITTSNWMTNFMHVLRFFSFNFGWKLEHDDNLKNSSRFGRMVIHSM